MPRAQFVKSAVLIATLSATLLGGSAHATPLVYTTTGTITSGVDATGVFGSTTDLIAETYSIALTLDSSLFQYIYRDAAGVDATGALSGTATESVTVAGVTKTFTFDLSQYSYGEITGYAVPGEGEVYSLLYGTSTSGALMQSEAYISSASTLLANTALTSSMSYTATAGDQGEGSFFMSSASEYVNFDGTAMSYSIQAVNANVPEPAPLALLGLGLAALGAARRKTRI